MDITEMPMSVKGNRYALVIMDYFSKFVRIYPMPDQRAGTVADALFDWVLELGIPERIHTDRGGQFESLMFQELCKKLGIRKTRTTPYHPESDGMVERFMRTLKNMVSKYIDGQGLYWDCGTKAYAMAYNSAVHETTGYTPFYLIHGFEPRLPLDVLYEQPKCIVPTRTYVNSRLQNLRQAHKSVGLASKKAAEKMTSQYNRKVRHEQYPVGSQVWVRDHTAAVGGKPKLGLPYKGPVTIVEKVGTPGLEVAYKTKDGKGVTRVVHFNDLKPLVARDGLGGMPNPVSLNGGSAVPGTPGQIGGSPTSVHFNGGSASPYAPRDTHPVEGNCDISTLMLLSGGVPPTYPDQQSASGPETDTPYVSRAGRVCKPPERLQAGVE